MLASDLQSNAVRAARSIVSKITQMRHYVNISPGRILHRVLIAAKKVTIMKRIVARLVAEQFEHFWLPIVTVSPAVLGELDR